MKKYEGPPLPVSSYEHSMTRMMGNDGPKTLPGELP
jgi:hypothetical protein